MEDAIAVKDEEPGSVRRCHEVFGFPSFPFELVRNSEGHRRGQKVEHGAGAGHDTRREDSVHSHDRLANVRGLEEILFGESGRRGFGRGRWRGAGGENDERQNPEFHAEDNFTGSCSL
jgi:hypothetical protein